MNLQKILESGKKVENPSFCDEYIGEELDPDFVREGIIKEMEFLKELRKRCGCAHGI